MTLLINEIYSNRIICAADRQITFKNKKPEKHKKLFDIPYLNGCVSYFGSCRLNNSRLLWEIIIDFKRKNNSITSLKEFAEKLCSELNLHSCKSLLQKNGTGVHVCGFNKHIPEFWFIRNIKHMNGWTYYGFDTRFRISEEVSKYQHQLPILFSNGDLRPCITGWNDFSQFASSMLKSTGKTLTNITDNELNILVKWKMQAISNFYSAMMAKKLISSPIDTQLYKP